MLLAIVTLLSTPAPTLAADEFHTARITRVAAHSQKALLVTASEDRSVRVWSLREGRLIRTISLHSGQKADGRIHALAISPDGRTLAFGGDTGRKNPHSIEGRLHHDYEIYLHDVDTGKRLRTLEVPTVIDHLAFTGSGRHLIASASQLTMDIYDDVPVPYRALTVFRTSDYQPVGEVPRYNAAVADEDSNGRFIVIGKPGGDIVADLLDKDFSTLEWRSFGGNPAHVALSPDGSRFAVSTLYGTVHVHSTQDLSQLIRIDLKQANGAEVDGPQDSTVAWSTDGRFLYYASALTCSKEGCAIRKWSDGGRGSFKDIVVAPHPVTHFVSLPDGRIVFATAGPAFGVLDEHGVRSVYRDNRQGIAVKATSPNDKAPTGAHASPATPTPARSEYRAPCIPPSSDAFQTGRYETRPGRHVLVDRDGAIILAPEVESLSTPAEGLALAIKDRKVGYLNRFGELAVPFRYELPSGDFSEGRAAVRLENRYGYIDERGAMVIDPRFETAGQFSSGLARVIEAGRTRYSYINKLGETVVPPKYTGADDFHEGLAAVQFNGKWGYIDRQGDWVIRPQFDSASRFAEGLASVRKEPCTARSDCTRQFIDRTGATVVSGIKAHELQWFSEGLALIEDARYRMGYIDKAGKTVIAPQFKSATPFSGGLAAVANEKGLWGYIDHAGKYVVPAQFEQTFPLSDGRGAVIQNDRWGYVDDAGRVAIPPRYIDALPFSDGVAAVCVAADDLPSASLPSSGMRGSDVARPRTAGADDIPRPRRFTLSPTIQQRVAYLHQEIEGLSRQKRYAEALPLAREALELVELPLPRDDPALLQPLFDLGHIFHELGNYRSIAIPSGKHVGEFGEAKDYLERALQLADAMHGPTVPAVATIANDLADLHASMGEFDEALDLKQRIVGIFGRAGPEASGAVRAINDMEIIRVGKLIHPRYSPKLAKALPLAVIQVSFAERKLGPQDVNVAKGLANVARIFDATRLGLGAAALRVRERAWEAFRRADPENWETIREQILLATDYSRLGDVARAERLEQAAAAVFARVFGKDSEASIEYLAMRARLLSDMGRVSEAVPVLESVVHYWEKQFEGSNDLQAVLALRRYAEFLGDAYVAAGQPAKATSAYEHVLRLKEQSSAMQKSLQAQLLEKLGWTLRLQGQFGRAQTRLHEALDLLAPDLAREGPIGLSLPHGVAVAVWGELAYVAVASGNLAAAREALLRAIKLDEQQFRFRQSVHGLSPDREVVAAGDLSGENRFYFELLDLTVQHFPRDAELVSRVVDLVLTRKGILLDAQIQVQGMRARLPERARARLDETRKARAELASLVLKRPSTMSDEDYAHALALLYEKLVTREREVAADRLTLLGGLPTVRHSRAPTVSAALPQGAALVEFVRIPAQPATAGAKHSMNLPGRYVAYTLSVGRQPTLVDLGNAQEIDTLVGDLQSAIRHRSSDGLVKNVLRELHARLWQPMESSLGNAKRVVVAPDGELYRLPFAALVDGKGEYLIHRYQLAYVAAGRDLAMPVARGPSQIGLLLIANPDFGLGHTNGSLQGISSVQPRSGLPFTPLPGTLREAKRIVPLIAGAREKIVLTGTEASKTALQRTPSPRLLHIATHGFFFDRETFGVEGQTYELALVRSGLALAGANGSGRTLQNDDGMMTALEISDMDLNATDLVVLSACDTGEGPIVRGQGVLGLRRAFTLAGARNVLVALWPVSDDDTGDLMGDFYEALRDTPPAEALHRAQLRAIDRAKAGKTFANPRIWAPFILQGAMGFSSMNP